MSDSPPPATPPHRRHGLIGSFGFAIAGLVYFFRTQRNARIHVVLGALACAFAAWLQISRVEWAILIAAIACVMILEGVNTAIETVVDLASPQVHPLAKTAKDLAAAVVLLAALAAVAVGLLILGVPLWHRLMPPQ